MPTLLLQQEWLILLLFLFYKPPQTTGNVQSIFPNKNLCRKIRKVGVWEIEAKAVEVIRVGAKEEPENYQYNTSQI